jgi:hypothetical protein
VHFLLCIEAFLRDMMKSDLHTTSMHIPTLVVIWISNVERLITQQLYCKEDLYTVTIGNMLIYRYIVLCMLAAEE